MSEMTDLEVFGDQPKPSPTDIPQEQSTRQKAIGGLGSFSQGTSLGFSDEITNLLNRLTPDPDEQMMQTLGAAPSNVALQNIQNQFEEQNPLTAGGLEFAGGMTTGILAGQPLMGSQFAQQSPLIASGLLGSILGGAQGVGQGETPQERLTGGAIGTATGFPLGLAGGYLGLQIGNRLLPAISRGVGNMFRSAQQSADDIIRPFLRESGSADDLVRTAQRLGPEGMLPDLGTPMAALTQTASSKNLPLQQKVSRALMNRAKGAANRLESSIRNTLGTKGKQVADVAKQITLERSQQAAPLYEQAYSQKVLPNQIDDFVSYLDDQISLTDNTTFSTALKQLKRSLFSNGKPKDSVEALHFARKALSDKASSAWNKGERQLWNLLKDARNQMDETLMPDSYRQAASIWSDDTAALDALKEGRKLLRLDPEDISDYLSRASQAEKDSFLVGATRAIRDKLGQTVDGGKVTSAFNKSNIREKLQPLFPDEGTFSQFLDDIERENIFNATKNYITGNSMTQLRQEAAKIFDQRSASIPTDRFDVMNRIGNFLSINKSKVTPQTYDELSNMLTKQGVTPELIERILKSPMREQLPMMFEQSAVPAATGASLGGQAAGAITGVQ